MMHCNHVLYVFSIAHKLHNLEQYDTLLHIMHIAQ